MRKIFALILALGLIVGCQSIEKEITEIEQNVVGQNEKAVETVVIKRAEDTLDDFKEYYAHMQKYDEEYFTLLISLYDHYEKADEDPSLSVSDGWVKQLEKYHSDVSGIHAISKRFHSNMKVPPLFEDLHMLRLEAFEFETMSIEKHLEFLESNDEDTLGQSMLLGSLARERMRQATKEIERINEELKKKFD